MKFGVVCEHQLDVHQNEDIVRLTPEELRRKMAAKEAAAAHPSADSA